ncbi:MAG: hypothetical protein RL434_3149, partial [Pseudomonadota bacterium]
MSANPDNQKSWMGTRLPRKEDLRLITGQGKYVADIVLPGMLHAVFVRSDYAHARLVSVDVSAALEAPGVVAVITGEEMKTHCRSLRQPVLLPNLPAKYPTYYGLAVDKVKFHGDPVAMVIARDKYQAVDAAELVVGDYEELPVVLDPEAALAADSPRVHDEETDNLMFEMTFTGGATDEDRAKNAAEVERIFQSADVVVKERFRVHRTGTTPMETRGVLAEWSASDGLTVYNTTQRPHIDRLAFADILDIPAEKVRVIAPRDMGGGFGLKAPFYRESV